MHASGDAANKPWLPCTSSSNSQHEGVGRCYLCRGLRCVFLSTHLRVTDLRAGTLARLFLCCKLVLIVFSTVCIDRAKTSGPEYNGLRRHCRHCYCRRYGRSRRGRQLATRQHATRAEEGGRGGTVVAATIYPRPRARFVRSPALLEGRSHACGPPPFTISRSFFFVFVLQTRRMAYHGGKSDRPTHSPLCV